MNKIIFIDFTCDLTHKSVIQRPIGASEFNFYTTINKLSSFYIDKEFFCFNKGTSINIDNVNYKNISEIDSFSFNEDDIIIIQRLFPDLNVLLKLKSKNIYLTQQDYDFNAILTQFQVGDNKKMILSYIYQNKNIKFILNSEFSKSYMKENFNRYNINFEEDRIHIIPNFIFEDFFKKSDNINKNPYQLVYASGWNKGIQHILRIFDYIMKKNNKFKLILMSPGYEYNNYLNLVEHIKENYANNITILGPTNKDEYCKIIQESYCVFAPPFQETFGCVFSEAYYLGTAVIADIRSGAVVEIIGNENITNYEDLDKTYEKLLEILNKSEKIELNNPYIFDITSWKKTIKI